MAPGHTSCSKEKFPAWLGCARYSRWLSVGLLLALIRTRRLLRASPTVSWSQLNLPRIRLYVCLTGIGVDGVAFCAAKVGSVAANRSADPESPQLLLVVSADQLRAQNQSSCAVFIDIIDVCTGVGILVREPR